MRSQQNLLISCVIPVDDNYRITSINELLVPYTPDLSWVQYLRAFNSFEYMIKSIEKYEISRSEQLEGYPSYYVLSECSVADEQYIQYMSELISSREMYYSVDLNVFDAENKTVIWDINNHMLMSASYSLLHDKIAPELRTARKLRCK